jgi:hypothetical protein
MQEDPDVDGASYQGGLGRRPDRRDQLQIDRRGPVPEPLDQPGQLGVPPDGREPDPKRLPVGPVVGFVELSRAGGRLEDRLRQGEELLSGRGQTDRPRAAIEQRRADRSLERLDLLREAGLGDVVDKLS